MKYQLIKDCFTRYSSRKDHIAKYVPSERIRQLSQPKSLKRTIPNPNSYYVRGELQNPEINEHKRSNPDRIEQLSQPKHRNVSYFVTIFSLKLKRV